MTLLLLYLQEIEEIYRNQQGIARLNQGIFRLKTFAQAECLTAVLSQNCPEPERVALGLFELLANGIEHGNLGIGHEEKWALMKHKCYAQEINRRLALPACRDRYVEVAFERNKARILFRIEDQGAGFNYNDYLEPAASVNETYHGRGIILAREYSFDRLDYSGAGNRVLAITNFPRG